MTLQFWIIEDEPPAARRLAKMMEQLWPAATLAGTYASVADTVAALQQQAPPQLLLMDIHLADGNSFHIFQQTAVTCPVIFTTAYDEYAIEAFKHNSVDYLLKPVKEAELQAALNKYQRLYSQPAPVPDYAQLLRSLAGPGKTYKQRFAVRYGEHLKTIDTSIAAYFFTENKASFLVTHDGKKYIVDYNMDQLEQQLDPRRFFRINRQFIIAIDAIAEMLTYSKARVLITLQPPSKLDTIVSSERAAAFKQWLDDAPGE